MPDDRIWEQEQTPDGVEYVRGPWRVFFDLRVSGLWRVSKAGVTLTYEDGKVERRFRTARHAQQFADLSEDDRPIAAKAVTAAKPAPTAKPVKKPAPAKRAPVREEEDHDADDE